MKRRRSENICKRFYQLVLGKSYDYNERIYIALQGMKCTYCLFSVSKHYYYEDVNNKAHCYVTYRLGEVTGYSSHFRSVIDGLFHCCYR